MEDKRQAATEASRPTAPAQVVVEPMTAVSVEDARKVVGAKNCLATCSG